MPTFWACRKIASRDLPLKVQIQNIKNNGKDPIYIFHSEDDTPISTAMMMAFCSVMVSPGQDVDLTKSPYLNNAGCPGSYPDYDVCIHSDGDIDVELQSSDACDRWQQEKSHPWNGAPYPNGQYTNKFKNQGGHIPVGGIPGLTVPAAGVPVGAGYWGQPLVPGFGHIPKQGIEFIEINITIAAPTKCTCGEKGNRHPGKCSHWCDLELDKNKQTM